MLKLGIYQHYKGGRYRVLGVAKHTETLEDVVVYEAQYDNEVSQLWVRPLDSFIQKIEINGEIISRFTFIE